MDILNNSNYQNNDQNSSTEPAEGKTIGTRGFTFVKKIAETHRSELWEVFNKVSGGAIKYFVAKLTNVDVYPKIENLLNSTKKETSFEVINKLVLSSEIDFVNSKKIKSFPNKSNFYEAGYSRQYHKIFTIIDKYDGNLTNYYQSPDAFLNDILIVLKNLHSTYYTSNNLSPQDVMFKKNENGHLNLFLIDYKNLTAFGEKINQDLTKEGNEYFSYNIVNGGIPTLYDDVESALYLYCFVSKVSMPHFSNSDFVSQQAAKKDLTYLPQIIKDAIFYVRNLAVTQQVFALPEFIDYIYNIFDNMKNTILQSGPLIVQTAPVNILNSQPIVSTFSVLTGEEEKIPPSELQIFITIKNQVSQWKNSTGQLFVPPEASDDFAKKIVEFVLRNQIYDSVTQNLIYQFLEIAVQS